MTLMSLIWLDNSNVKHFLDLYRFAMMEGKIIPFNVKSNISLHTQVFCCTQEMYICFVASVVTLGHSLFLCLKPLLFSVLATLYSTLSEDWKGSQRRLSMNARTQRPPREENRTHACLCFHYSLAWGLKTKLLYTFQSILPYTSSGRRLKTHLFRPHLGPGKRRPRCSFSCF